MAFDTIIDLIDIPDIQKPFEFSRDPIYGLMNPLSKATFLLLLFYSIEPPLYFFLNTACRQKDAEKLPMLGPFAAALYMVL